MRPARHSPLPLPSHSVGNRAYRAYRAWAPSTHSPTPVMRNERRCEKAPHLPCKCCVHAAKRRTCHAKRRSGTGADSVQCHEPSAISVMLATQKMVYDQVACDKLVYERGCVTKSAGRCVCVCLYVCVCVCQWRRREEAEEERRGYRIKNKNPTKRCGK